jgi:hypothetical protein
MYGASFRTLLSKDFRQDKPFLRVLTVGRVLHVKVGLESGRFLFGMERDSVISLVSEVIIRLEYEIFLCRECEGLICLHLGTREWRSVLDRNRSRKMAGSQFGDCN